MNRPVAIAPSILPADFSRLGEECLKLQEAGADRIHWDVMDGVFVPNLSLGPDVIAAIRPHLTIDFEAHLMVVNPDQLIHRYVEAGCSTITVHAEACTHLHRTLSLIADLGATPAVALNPHTPAEVITNVRDLLGLVLVMTVNPGFGGQAYIAPMEAKMTQVAEMLEGYDCDLQVDGGISPTTIAAAAAAGANVFVSGSALFNHPDGLTGGTKDLRQRAEDAQS
ncbi:MAG: ribulose-phosphate 3-epimerase [Acidimicrobiales bacterium]|jgi:ribulose-phosphate 3-epimerase